MDIRQFSVQPTARLDLRDASDQLIVDEEGKQASVNLYGPGSKQYGAAQAAQNNRMVEKLRRKGKVDQTAEQQAQEKAEFLADCTESFENIEIEGLTGRALAIAVYSDPSIGFIGDQVAKFIGDWSNFTKGSAKN